MASDFGDESGEKMLDNFERFAERMGEEAMRRRAEEFIQACEHAKSAAAGKDAPGGDAEWAKLDMREFQVIEGYDELKPIIDAKLDAHGADHTWFTDPKTSREYLLFEIKDAREVWASFDELSKESSDAKERASENLKREVEKARDGRSGRDAEKSRGAPTEKEAAKTAEHAATEKQMSFVSALHDKGVISDEEMEDLGANPTVRDANALLNRHKEDAGYLELKKSRNAERDKRPLSERAEEARKASKALERDGKRRERQRTRKPRNRKYRGK